MGSEENVALGNTPEQTETNERNVEAYRRGQARNEQEANESEQASSDLKGNNTFGALGGHNQDTDEEEALPSEATLSSGAPNPRVAGITADPRELMEGVTDSNAGDHLYAVGDHTHAPDGSVEINEITQHTRNNQQSGERTTDS